jgi:hypothetical protein
MKSPARRPGEKESAASPIEDHSRAVWSRAVELSVIETITQISKVNVTNELAVCRALE